MKYLILTLFVFGLLVSCTKKAGNKNKISISFTKGKFIKIPQTEYSLRFNGMTYVSAVVGKGEDTAFPTWDIKKNEKIKTHEKSIIQMVFGKWKVTSISKEYSNSNPIVEFSKIDSLDKKTK